MKRQVVHTDKVPPAKVPLSQAIRVGDWIFASGQLGMDPKTGRLAEGGIALHARQFFLNPRHRARKVKRHERPGQKLF